MDFVVNLSSLVGLTLGLTEAVKRLLALTDKQSKRFVPAISLLIGVTMSLIYLGVAKESVGFGIFVGLSAVGLFSGVKNSIGN